MKKMMVMLVSGVALGAVGIINPNGLLAEDVVEENLASETTAAQTDKQSAGDKWDRREHRWDRREDVRESRPA
jgi:hypothetical protein